MSIPTQIPATAQSGTVYGQSGTYATARDTGTTAGSGAFLVGQLLSAGTYSCYETFLAFDTSQVSAVPTFMQLVIPNPNWFTSGSDFTIRVGVYDWGTSLTTGDFRTAAQLGGITLIGNISTAGISAQTTLRIPLTASAITLNGSSRFVVWSDRHAAGTAPSGDERVQGPVAFTGSDPSTPLLVLGTGLDTLSVQIGFGSTPTSRTTWTNVTGDVKAISTTRGRASELDDFQTGEATIVLANDTSTYDPDNAAGPYVGQILPSIPVKVSVADATGAQCDLFNGYVKQRGGWDFDYQAGPTGANQSTVTVHCVDFLGLLAVQNLTAVAAIPPATDPVPLYPGYRTGALLSALVSDGTIPQPFLPWNTPTSTTATQGYLGGGTALQYVQDLALAEGGAFYCLQDGSPYFEGRYDVVTVARMTTSQGTLDDSGAGISFRNTGFTSSFGDQIYNESTITPAGHPSSSYSDATSITTYGQSNIDRSGLNMAGNEEAYARAVFYVTQFKDALKSPITATLAPRKGGGILNAAVRRELRDRMIVKFKPPGLGSQITTNVFVRQIHHEINTSQLSWDTTFEFEPADRLSFTSGITYFTVGTSAVGGTDVLGY